MPVPSSAATVATTPASRPRRIVGRAGYFALSFGTIIGSAWLGVMGDWLGAAGPGGALLGFLLGASVVMLIAFGYAELAARLPAAGGEFIYALHGLGKRAAFAVGWFLTLDAIAICAFEGVMLAAFVTRLLPQLNGAVAYELVGIKVTQGGLILGLGGALVLGLINLRGLALSIGFQRLATYSFMVVAFALIVGGAWQGEAAHLEPWFASSSDTPWWVGTGWIFATCAMFLNGFQVALYTIEERRDGLPVRGVVITMIWGLVAAVAFYCLIVLSAASMAPWPSLLSSDLPAVAAFSRLATPRLMETIILGAACVSLLKTWNALIIFGSQMLVALARQHMIPRSLAVVHTVTGTPTRAIVLITAGSMALILFGRGAVLPIVNMASICLAVTFVISLLALLRLRRRSTPETEAAVSFKVPGNSLVIWIATIGAAAMALVAALEPAVRAKGIPIEWMLLACWGAIGVLFWKFRRAQA